MGSVTKRMHANYTFSPNKRKRKESTLFIIFYGNSVCFLPKAKRLKIQKTCFPKIGSLEI